MEISNTDWPSGQVPGSRRAAPQARVARSQGAAEARTAEPQAAEVTAHAQLRQRILELQRSAAGLQRALSGLEGFRELLRAGGGSAQAGRSDAEVGELLRKAGSRGQSALGPYSERLQKALRGGDAQAVEGLIAEVSEALRERAAELDRFHTALQNSQSLSGPADPLAALAQAVRGAGEQLVQTDGKSVLELLG